MGSTAAYSLSVVVGLLCGAWALGSIYRRYPALRDKPPTLRRTLGTACGAGGLGAALSWLVGDWNGIYLTGMGSFGVVCVLGDFIWPRLRSGGQHHRSPA